MISAGQITVGLTATAVDGVSNTESIITIHNNDNATGIWLGNQNVTVNNGLLLLKEQSYQFNLKPLEQIYAISDKAGHIISYMKQVH
jgi:hypothetical protein